MDRYFVLNCTEDGDKYLSVHTKEQLLKNLKSDEDGHAYWGSNRMIAREAPEDLDSFCGLVIIKGEIVVPKEKKVVKELDID